MILRMRKVTSVFIFGFITATTLASKPSGTIIVLNKSEANASLLSQSNGNEFAKISTGVGPHEIAVSENGRIAVVGNYGQKKPGSSLTVIDLVSHSPIKTIELGRYHRPHGITFLDADRTIAVTAEQEKKLLVIDIKTGTVQKAIDTDQAISHMVVATPDGHLAFVANIGSGSVSVIDLQQSKLFKIIQTGVGAEGVDISPDGQEVWVSNRGANTISVISTQSLEVTETLACKDVPIRVKFTPDGSRVLISNAQSGDVAVFDTETRREISRIAMKIKAVEKTDDRLFGDRFGDSPVPVGIVIPPDGKLAYVANTNADLITVIDLTRLEIVDRLTAGKEPDGLGFTPLDLTKQNDK